MASTRTLMRNARSEFIYQRGHRPFYWKPLMWLGERACSAVLAGSGKADREERGG